MIALSGTRSFGSIALGAGHEQSSAETVDHDVGAFLTYKRYLQYLQLALSSTYGHGPAAGPQIREAVKALPAVHHIQRRTLEPVSRRKVTRSLGMAWDRESHILTMPSKSAMLAEDLPGAATDAYYAMFHGAHAWIAASGQPPCPKHAQVLQVLGNAATHRRLFPPPWDLACQGYPTDREVEFL